MGDMRPVGIVSHFFVLYIFFHKLINNLSVKSVCIWMDGCLDIIDTCRHAHPCAHIHTTYICMHIHTYMCMHTCTHTTFHRPHTKRHISHATHHMPHTTLHTHHAHSTCHTSHITYHASRTTQQNTHHTSHTTHQTTGDLLNSSGKVFTLPTGLLHDRIRYTNSLLYEDYNK